MLAKLLALLFCVASVTLVTSQDLTIECNFVLDVYENYYCILENIEVLDPALNVIFGGDHAEGKTNDDVEIIIIYNSTTPFMMPELFTTFPNVNDLTIESCNLESIDIPETVQLYWLDIYRNNISRIESGSIRNQSILLFTFLDNNNIEEIDEDAFEGIGTSGILLSLYGNNISELAPRTFVPLSSVFYLDLEGNSLTSIDEELLSHSPALVTLYLEFNEINQISPRFADNLGEDVRYFGMRGNLCVDQNFSLGSESAMASMHNALWPCFNNFTNGTTDGERSITMKFVGHMQLFDEFGNLVVRV